MKKTYQTPYSETLEIEAENMLALSTTDEEADPTYGVGTNKKEQKNPIWG